MRVDLIIKNINVFNSYLKEFISTNVAILNGKFLYIGSSDLNKLEAKKIIEGNNKYLIPGLIDIHLHIESSMVTPCAFSHELIKNGVTTIVAEPHEIANVFGVKGIIEMIKSDKECRADIFYGVPSSVPSSDYETTGSSIYKDEIKELLKEDNVICLGEVMNYRQVINDPLSKINQIVKFTKENYPHLTIEGHCPKLLELDLAKFIYNGIDSDHTQQTLEGIRQRIMNGMFVEIQEKSLSKEIIEFLSDNRLFEHFCFVTDDVMADSFIEEGHLNKILKKAINLGMKPVDAIYAATYTPARRMGLTDRGSIAPGKLADFIILDNLNEFKISEVYKEGLKIFCEDIKYSFEARENTFPSEFYQSVNLDKVSENDFKIKAPIDKGNIRCRIMKVADGTTFTEEIFDSIPVKNGLLAWEDTSYCLIAVLERHKKTGNIALGLVGGDTIKKGSVATTYAHDHHNLLVVGKSVQDIVKAANFIIENQGGYCVVENNEIIASLKLPVAGILSEKSVSEVGEDLRGIKKAMRKIGYKHYNPIMSLSTNSLPVSPELKITDQGLIKVSEGRVVDIFEEA